jgi:hypothetical protein
VRSGTAQVIAGDLGLGRLVDQPAEGVLDLGEVLTGEGVDREDERRDVRRDAGQVDADRLVVTLACTGEVVAGVLHRSVLARELLKPHLVDERPRAVEQQR